MTTEVKEFIDIARLPHPSDNCAVATCIIEKGTPVRLPSGEVVSMTNRVLEGHRFAVKNIKKGERLYSWNLQFGTAIKDMVAGEYLINVRGHNALLIVDPDIQLPSEPNFNDEIDIYQFDEKTFQPAEPLPPVENDERPLEFMGYKRPSTIGVGTRNYVVVLAINPLCDAVIRKCCSECKLLVEDYPNVNGVVPCAHTEGIPEVVPNNLDKIIRVFAGLITHPNIGGIVIVSTKDCRITEQDILKAIQARDVDIQDIPHEFVYMSDFESAHEAINASIKKLLPIANQAERTPQSVSNLVYALQCGGSDAFSGVTANPLQGKVAEMLIRRGGCAILAETDELIGAESYITKKCRDVETAKKFMEMQAVYERNANNHGISAQNNPSGGNFYRGLYNIAIKSLGAAMKKSADQRLDACIDYAAKYNPVKGYQFMDSPGNDLESVCGQVASGCNVIMFSTGNGSITNFPFVPLLTTSCRYNRLKNDLDFNAGEYLDGTPLEELATRLYDHNIKIASGELTFGEKAGHSQIQIWRNWAHKTMEQYESEMKDAAPDDKPLQTKKPDIEHRYTYTGLKVEDIHHPSATKVVPDAGCVVYPTSLCSGEIARAISSVVESSLAHDYNEKQNKYLTYIDKSLYEQDSIEKHLYWSTPLVHTEGCGEAYGKQSIDGISTYDRIACGHLLHPHVYCGFLVEHGCEKTLLTYFTSLLKKKYNTDINDFGMASVQKDCGIHNTINKACNYLFPTITSLPNPEPVENVPIKGLVFGFLTKSETVSSNYIRMAANTINAIIDNGGVVVLPQNDLLLLSPEFKQLTIGKNVSIKPNIKTSHYLYEAAPGLYIMKYYQPCDYTELLCALGGTGASILYVYNNTEVSLPGHVFIPTLMMSNKEKKDIDFVIQDSFEDNCKALNALTEQTLSRAYVPYALKEKNTNFQIMRTSTGFSL